MRQKYHLTLDVDGVEVDDILSRYMNAFRDRGMGTSADSLETLVKGEERRLRHPRTWTLKAKPRSQFDPTLSLASAPPSWISTFQYLHLLLVNLLLSFSLGLVSSTWNILIAFSSTDSVAG